MPVHILRIGTYTCFQSISKTSTKNMLLLLYILHSHQIFKAKKKDNKNHTYYTVNTFSCTMNMNYIYEYTYIPEPEEYFNLALRSCLYIQKIKKEQRKEKNNVFKVSFSVEELITGVITIHFTKHI